MSVALKRIRLLYTQPGVGCLINSPQFPVHDTQANFLNGGMKGKVVILFNRGEIPGSLAPFIEAIGVKEKDKPRLSGRLLTILCFC